MRRYWCKISVLVRRFFSVRFNSEIERLQQELQTYRHAFETTVIDRDAKLAELNHYKSLSEAVKINCDRSFDANEGTHELEHEELISEKKSQVTQSSAVNAKEAGDLLHSAWEYERQGSHEAALDFLERNAGSLPIPELYFAQSRNHFSLAASGNDAHVFPACFSALEAIENSLKNDPNGLYATEILRWCITRFSDAHRLVVREIYRSRVNNGPSLRSDVESQSDAIEAKSNFTRPPLLNSAGKVILEMAAQAFFANEQVKAAKLIFELVAIDPRYARELGSLKQENAFHLAQLFSTSDPVAAKEVLKSYRFSLPGPYDDQIAPNYLLTSALVEIQRKKAKSRGVRGLLISSLPKSASEFLCYTIAEALDIPVVRVSLGNPFLGTIRSEWVKEVFEGGGITHDHFGATPENLAELRQANVRDIVILVRDPRAVAWSAMKMQEIWSPYWGSGLVDAHFVENNLSEVDLDAQLFHPFLQTTIKANGWIEGWLKAMADPYNNINVHFVRFQELTKSA